MLRSFAVMALAVLLCAATPVPQPGVPTPTGTLQGVAPFTWDGTTWLPSGAAGSSSAPANYQPTDKSGTITLGGVAQTQITANASRHGCIVQNQSSADLWLNDLGVTAAAIQPSIWLPAGAVWTCSTGGTSLLAISIYGATTGQSFAAREW